MIFRHPVFTGAIAFSTGEILEYIAALRNDKVRMRALYSHGVTTALLETKGSRKDEIMTLLSLPAHMDPTRNVPSDRLDMPSGSQYGIENAKFILAVGGEDKEEEDNQADKSWKEPGSEQEDDSSRHRMMKI